MASIHTMEVSKTVKGADGKNVRKPIGSLDVILFDLSDITHGALPIADKITEDNSPEYNSLELNFLQSSLTAAIKAAARNKLDSKAQTVSILGGQKIAETIAELVAPTVRTAGEAQTIAKEFSEAFEVYLKEHSGKKVAVQAVLVSMVAMNKRSALPMESEVRRNSLIEQLQGFAEKATEEQLSRFSDLLENLADVASNAETVEDEDF